MNILFITEDHSPNNYGVTTALSQFADQLVQRQNNVVLVATGTNAVSQLEQVQIELISPKKLGAAWRWSPNLVSRINNLISRYNIDIIHIHGVWMAAQWAGLKAARQTGTPLILSVHGMWEQWFWKEDNFLRICKKNIYFGFVLRQVISFNTILHAITPIEKKSIHHLFPYNRIELIPNAIYVDKSTSIKIKPEKMILFIGRLHPKKGVELLLYGFSKAKLGQEWRLVIAGPEEDAAYSKMLKDDAVRYGLSEQVNFIGPVYGKEKWELIRKAWVIVVPSFSEVVGMVNLEAASCCIPTITTYPTGLLDWQQGGGLLINPDIDSLANSLIFACGWSLDERIERGEQSRQLVLDNYSWDAVMPQWEKLYANVAKLR